MSSSKLIHSRLNRLFADIKDCGVLEIAPVGALDNNSVLPLFINSTQTDADSVFLSESLATSFERIWCNSLFAVKV